MACGAVDGLGAITAGCGVGCPPRPPAGRWVVADRIDSTRYGSVNVATQVTARLGSVPARDSIGRHAHVAGIYLQGTYRVTAADGTTDAIPGYDQLAVWNQLWLKDASNWQYWAGSIDGRDIADDAGFRRLAPMFKGLPTDLSANAGAGTHDLDVSLYAQLSRFDFDKGPMVEGCVPLAALQALTNALQFTTGTPGNGATYTDISNTGFQGDINVWLDLVYRDALVIDEPWMLDSYQVTGQSGTVRYAERRHEYLFARCKPEDTGGQDLSDTGTQTWQANGDTLYASLSAAEVAIRANLISSDQMGSTSTGSAAAIYTKSGVTISTFAIQPYCHRRQDAPAGFLSYNYSSLGGHTAGIRYLHRTVACQSSARATQIALAAGCGMAAASQVQSVVPSTGCTCSMRSDLPIAIVPPHHAPGMSFYTGLI